MTDADELRKRAEEALRHGDANAAGAFYKEVVRCDPADPVAHNFLGNRELAQGNCLAAESHFRIAIESDPGQPALLFNHAVAARGAGMTAEAAASLRLALEVDPYFVQAIFQLAALYEEEGDSRSAAQLYRNLLDTAPPEVVTDARFGAALEQARLAVERDNVALANLVEEVAPPASRRMAEAVDALLGKSRIYVSQPTFLNIPRLPALPFIELDGVSWLGELEDAASDIEAELRALVGSERDGDFVPYVANPPGIPANQWQALDHSPNWGAFFFWKHGQRIAEHCDRYPVTAGLLERMPMPRLVGRAPNAFFSQLKPRTRIPPHTGVTNARLTCHLPLIVPDGCGFRVGAETRSWKPGKAWVFDDTIEHEAWNDSNQTRIILIFDIWHPMLDDAEQMNVAALLNAYDEHLGGRIGLSDTL